MKGWQMQTTTSVQGYVQGLFLEFLVNIKSGNLRQFPPSFPDLKP